VSGNYKVFIVSGEASGDLHGSNLIKALRAVDPDLSFCGMGGDRMKRVGLKGLDMKEVAVVGVAEVFKRLGHLLGIFKRLKTMLDDERPDIAVFIDFPDFNLRLAKEAKKRGIPVIYYISPQVWAWRKGRIRKIARLVDRMLVIFPFEVPLYEREKVNVEYVGHPLSELSHCKMSSAEARDSLGIKGKQVVAILPGSRVEEMERLLPVMMEAATLIRKEVKDCVFVLPLADTLDDSIVSEFLEEVDCPIIPVKGRMYEALKASDAAIVASGTATLEAALMLVPMVIVYKLSFVSYLFAKMLVGIRDVGLPNIIVGKRIVKELIQSDASPGAVAKEIVDILRDENKRTMIKEGLEDVKKRLGEAGASERAAMAVYKGLRCVAGGVE
jgi:lipid-A-disaccharide synthase